MPRDASDPLRVTFCWAGFSGYMAACWRALADRHGIQLHVVAKGAQRTTDFSSQLMQGLDWTPYEECGPSYARLRDLVLSRRPDVVVVSGWNHPAYRRLVREHALRDCRFVLAVDTPWQGRPRQQLAQWLLRPFLSHCDGAAVCGERSWQYVRRLGFHESRILRGLYGIDYDSLSKAFDQRISHDWPRGFLFAARLVHDKGVDILARAYAAYRSRVAEPWPLTCCGQGPLRDTLAPVPGVRALGFQQPTELFDHMARAGVFVLPSRFDPWPLAVVEACAAGLPVICSEACGSAVELVRSQFNGFPVATGDVEALAQAMVHAHGRHADLPAMGERSRVLASAYSAQRWADRWVSFLADSRTWTPRRRGGSRSVEP